MKKVVIWVGIIVAMFGGLIWFSQSNTKDAAPSTTFATVTQDVINGAKLYDVRNADEYKAGHLPEQPIGACKICKPVNCQM